MVYESSILMRLSALTMLVVCQGLIIPSVYPLWTRRWYSVNADEKFENVTKEMIDRFLENNPDIATELGLHDPYDYLLPDGSTKRLLKNLELEEEFLNKLKETVNRRELNDDHRLDWEVLEKVHEYSRFMFYEHRLHELNPDAFDILGGLVFMMLTRDYAPLEKRIDAIASRLELAPRYLEEFRSRFEKSSPVKLWTEVALESAQGVDALFLFLLQIAKGNVSEKTYGRLSKAVERLMPELEKHLKWLNSVLPRSTASWALGREKYEELIQLRDRRDDVRTYPQAGRRLSQRIEGRARAPGTADCSRRDRGMRVEED